MGRARSQSGEGKLGCVLWTLLVLVGALIAWKAIPVKIASSQLYDFMVEQAKWSANADPLVIERRIHTKAVELNLPVDPKKVKVERIGDHIRMRVTYTVPLDFPGYTYNWNFDHQLDRDIYIF
jgi:hypothetical protein